MLVKNFYLLNLTFFKDDDDSLIKSPFGKIYLGNISFIFLISKLCVPNLYNLFLHPTFYYPVDIFLSHNIRRIFYLDLTILDCSDPQIGEIAYQLLLSALIQARSPRIY